MGISAIGLTRIAEGRFVSVTDPWTVIDASGSRIDRLADPAARVACVLSADRWCTLPLDSDLVAIDVLVAQLEAGTTVESADLHLAAVRLIDLACGLTAGETVVGETVRALRQVGSHLADDDPLRSAIRQAYDTLSPPTSDGSLLSQTLANWGHRYLDNDELQAAKDVRLVDLRMLSARIVDVQGTFREAAMTVEVDGEQARVTIPAQRGLPDGVRSDLEVSYPDPRTQETTSASVAFSAGALTAVLPGVTGSSGIEIRSRGVELEALTEADRAARTEINGRYLHGWSLVRRAEAAASMVTDSSADALSTAALRDLLGAARLSAVTGQNRQADQLYRLHRTAKTGGLVDPEGPTRPLLAELHQLQTFAGLGVESS